MSINKTIRYNLQRDLSNTDLNKIRAAGIVGVDIETTGLDPRSSELCLLQVSDIDGNFYLVKTSNWQRAILLHEFLTDPTIIKVFHFAIFDCAFILAKMGIEVSNIYCTKIASKIAFSNREKFSLASLVYDFLGIKLDKEARLTDWCEDSLTSAQLAYAVNDVLWLIKLKSFLDDVISTQPPLVTGITPSKLNQYCQSTIPLMVQLWLNNLYEDNFIFSY